MKKYDDTGCLFKGIIFILTSVIILLGYRHSYYHHSKRDIIIAICLPPYAFYRGIESFWHEDEPKLSIHEERRQRVEICTFYLSYEGFQNLQYDEGMEGMLRFSGVISTLPEGEQLYLKQICKEYIILNKYYMDDFLTAFDIFLSTGDFQLNKGVLIESYEKKLQEVGVANMKGLITFAVIEYSEILDTVSFTPKPNHPLNKEFKDIIENSLKVKEDLMKITYKDIFGEDFIED